MIPKYSPYAVWTATSSSSSSALSASIACDATPTAASTRWMFLCVFGLGGGLVL